MAEPTSATDEQPSQRLAGLGRIIAGVRGSPIECCGTMDLLRRIVGTLVMRLSWEVA